MLNVKFYKKNAIHIVTYLLYIIIYLVTLQLFGMGDSYARIRYYILAVAVIIIFIELILRYRSGFFKNKKIYSKELLFTIFTSVIFALVSINKAKLVGYPLDMRTLVQISLMLLPSLYVFGFNNIFSTKTIIKFMKFTLIAVIIAYFCEPKHTIFNFLNPSNWASINIFTSKSFTESSLCSETFLQLFLFFNYFKNIKDENINKKSLKLYCMISLIFTILSFKRLSMVFALSIILLRKIVDLRSKINKKIIYILSIFFTIITIYYLKFMTGELNILGINVYEFTTGRDYILSLWQKTNYFSYGYGTSMLVIGRYLEMDLIQIYLELNVYCLFLFAYTFFRIAKNNLYSLLIMCYVFFNMLTASSLPTSLPWIILLTTISLISSDKCKDENININIESIKIKTR